MLQVFPPPPQVNELKPIAGMGKTVLPRAQEKTDPSVQIQAEGREKAENPPPENKPGQK